MNIEQILTIQPGQVDNGYCSTCASFEDFIIVKYVDKNGFEKIKDIDVSIYDFLRSLKNE